jgi:hypothetical protein
MKNWGGHFTPELGGHFKLELGGQYHRNMQTEDALLKITLEIINTKLQINLIKIVRLS